MMLMRYLVSSILIAGIISAIPVEFIPPISGKIWALLVAGSNDYINYRHQILKKHGLPDENIIVMMYDDIANSTDNPTPGVIINAPNGPNVYHEVKKDYTGKHVTPENFLNVLKGNETGMKGIGSGQVIKSGPNDYIFVNFVDHGGSGVLCFPYDDLHAVDLYNTLHYMVKQKKFKKMVLYVEACFSGSIFDNILEDNLDIFVMTAADPRESSFACYYDNKRQTYLGDVFSVNWMREAETEKLESSSLNHLFEKTRTNTTTSHVEEYGDLDIGNTFSSRFLQKNSNPNSSIEQQNYPDPNKDAVLSLDVPLEIIRRKLDDENNSRLARKLKKEIKSIDAKRLKVDTVINKILRKVTNDDDDKMYELQTSKYDINRNNMYCSKMILKTFSHKCFKISRNPYVAKKTFQLTNMCSVDYIDTDLAITAIMNVCNGMRQVTGVL